MKLILFQFLLILSFNSFCMESNSPDSLFNKTNVQISVDLNNNKIEEILFYKDTGIVSRQVFINGRLSRIFVYDDFGVVKEMTFMFKNRRINETREFQNGVISKKIIFRRNGKIDIIYFYEEGRLMKSLVYGRDGQPLSR